MAVALELALNNTTEPAGRYVGWAPCPAQLRVLDPDGAVDPIPVSLDSPGAGGRVVFAAQRNAEAADQLNLDLPVDGAPVDFWVLGRFQSPSRSDGDARITVRPAAGNEVLHSVPLMVRVRKDAQTLTFAERNRFLSALARLNERGTYQNYRDMHLDNTTDEAHSLDAFLPWHRAYLLDLERELQAIDPSVALPYWRFDEPAPRVFSQTFMGRTETAAGAVRFTPSNPLGLFATDGQIGVVRRPAFDTQLEPAGNLLGPVVPEQPVVRSQLPYTRLRPPLENNPHGRAHTSFDLGFIREIGNAVRDPLFFLLHANVDRLWAKWQWFNSHFDLASQATYFFRSSAGTAGATRIGHNALDTMWPWNNVRTFPRPSTAPRTPFPGSSLVAAPGPAPTVGAVIDYQGVVNPDDQLGFDYDDVPFES
jgi:tyrosinase